MKWSIENNTNDILIYESEQKNASYWPKSGMTVSIVNGSIVIKSGSAEALNAPYPDIVSPSSSDVKDLLGKIYGYIGNVGYGSLKGGYGDYSDSTTSGSPIAIAAASGYVTLTNDGVGSYTNTDNLPFGVTGLYNSSTNSIDLSQLSIGDQVIIRIDIDIIVSTNNTGVSVDAFLGGGGGTYSLNFGNRNFKAPATYKMCEHMMVHLGDSNTKDNPVFIKVDTDTDCEVVVNGWYISAIMRGQ